MYADYGKCRICVTFLQPELLMFSLSFPRVSQLAVALKSYASLVIEQMLTLFCTRSKGNRNLHVCVISYYCRAHAWPAVVSFQIR